MLTDYPLYLFDKVNTKGRGNLKVGQNLSSERMGNNLEKSDFSMLSQRNFRLL